MKVQTTKKRIAVVVSHPIQHFCPQYSSWAALDGVDLRVFFASRHGLDPYEDKNFARTVQWNQLVLDFPHEFLPGAATRRLDARIDCIEIEARLSEFAPHIVVAYGYAQPLQRRTMRWVKSNAKQSIMIGDSELRSRRGFGKRALKSMLLPRIFSKIDLFLSVGDANEAYYRHYGVDERKLIRGFFPIDIRAFAAEDCGRDDRRARLRADLGIPDSHVVLLMVGKLVAWKRQKDLVEFSNRMQTCRGDVTVVYAGTGPDEQRLREETQKCGAGGVIFAGFIPPSELVDFYYAADVYVHCSEVEPHSLAVSEAIYSSLPVVLSDRCGSYGPSDDVREGLNGFVYPCGDIEKLSAALLALIERSELRTSMATESRRIAVENQSLAHGKALLQALEILSMAERT